VFFILAHPRHVVNSAWSLHCHSWVQSPLPHAGKRCPRMHKPPCSIYICKLKVVAGNVHVHHRCRGINPVSTAFIPTPGQFSRELPGCGCSWLEEPVPTLRVLPGVQEWPDSLSSSFKSCVQKYWLWQGCAPGQRKEPPFQDMHPIMSPAQQGLRRKHISQDFPKL